MVQPRDPSGKAVLCDSPRHNKQTRALARSTASSTPSNVHNPIQAFAYGLSKHHSFQPAACLGKALRLCWQEKVWDRLAVFHNRGNRSRWQRQGAFARLSAAISQGGGESSVQENNVEENKVLSFVRAAFPPKPVAAVQLSTRSTTRGDTLAVLVQLPQPKDFLEVLVQGLTGKLRRRPLVEVLWEDRPVPAYPLPLEPYVWRALVPTTPLDQPGPRKLVVRVNDGRHQPYRSQLSVSDREYPVESIWLPEEKSAQGGTSREYSAVDSFRALRTPLQLWRGAFRQPSEGPVTTGYGVQRYYNGVFAQGYFHRGVDYGSDEGSPVRAPAGGRVVLVGREAEGFAVHGNCVGLDHGQGVGSLMMHLADVDVSEGTHVTPGQVIGTVGETGRATGPHLHWGLYVNGDCVDPNQWLSEQSWL